MSVDGKQHFPLIGPFKGICKADKDLLYVSNTMLRFYITVLWLVPKVLEVLGSSGKLVGTISPILVPLRRHGNSYIAKRPPGKLFTVSGGMQQSM